MSDSLIALAMVDGTATFTDGLGRTYTASGISTAPGDVVGVEQQGDGMWLTVGDKRFPLRHGDDPHPTEMLVTTWPPNPHLPV